MDGGRDGARGAEPDRGGARRLGCGEQFDDLAGGGVRGGRVYGKWPGLAVERRYEGRDLAVTTDFRDVFSEIVSRHLCVVDPSPIFPGYAVRQEKFPGLFAA